MLTGEESSKLFNGETSLIFFEERDLCKFITPTPVNSAEGSNTM